MTTTLTGGALATPRREPFRLDSPTAPSPGENP